MDARPLGSRVVSLPIARPLGAMLAHWLTLSLLMLLVLLGAIVCARRLGGSLVNPLHPAALLVVGCLAGGWSLAFRATLFHVRARLLQPVAALAFDWVPTLLAALVGLAICVPGTSPLGLVALWGVFVGVEAVSRSPHWKTAVARRVDSVLLRRVAQPEPATESCVPVQNVASHTPGVEDAFGDESALDDEVSQRLLRRRDPDGAETIEGLVRVDFTAGERTAHGHVAFCPPFAAMPACDAEQVDGPPARIRAAQVFAHGVRFDVKLDEPAEAPTSVLVEFSARCAAQRAESA